MFILYSFILQFKPFNTLFDWRWGAWLGWLAPMLAWDALGLDWWVMQALGTSEGFALRNNFWLEEVLHQGVQRALSIGFLLCWVWAVSPTKATAWPSRSTKTAWLGAVSLSLLLIGLIKAHSLTSCPWSMTAFGGSGWYVSHWAWGQPDGANGGCFPGGHVSSVLGFVALLPFWLGTEAAPWRRRAKTLAWAIALAAVALGTVQTLRGAHYPSHTWWTAWLCVGAGRLWYGLARIGGYALPPQPKV